MAGGRAGGRAGPRTSRFSPAFFFFFSLSFLRTPPAFLLNSSAFRSSKVVRHSVLVKNDPFLDAGFWIRFCHPRRLLNAQFERDDLKL
ncbi:hypothetical protein SDJN02_21020, partial [Cucurbita argyrosperma subsp. argyrosperma]